MRTTKDDTLEKLGQAVHDCFAAECSEQEIAEAVAEVKVGEPCNPDRTACAAERPEIPEAAVEEVVWLAYQDGETTRRFEGLDAEFKDGIPYIPVAALPAMTHPLRVLIERVYEDRREPDKVLCHLQKAKRALAALDSIGLNEGEADRG